ncbi:MAG: hypothetical protein AB7Q97_20475 [Gammaproteobacteria bacterium]
MNLISRTLDYVGIALLAGTALTLGGALWFTDELVSAMLIRSVPSCLAATVGVFMLARVIDLVQFAASNPGAGYQRQPEVAMRRSADVIPAHWGRAPAAADAAQFDNAA